MQKQCTANISIVNKSEIETFKQKKIRYFLIHQIEKIFYKSFLNINQRYVSHPLNFSLKYETLFLIYFLKYYLKRKFCLKSFSYVVFYLSFELCIFVTLFKMLLNVLFYLFLYIIVSPGKNNCELNNIFYKVS